MSIPDVDRGRILAALEEFDQSFRLLPGWDSWEADTNHKYAILQDGRRYPVKQILSMATGASKNSFSGGDEANSYLLRRNFDVISLADGLPINNRIQACLEAIMARYVAARTEDPFSHQHPIHLLFEALRLALTESSLLRRFPHVRITYSTGKGNWAHQPWLAFMDERESTSASQGVLCGLLFHKDMTAFRLDLGQGIAGSSPESLREKAEAIRREYPGLLANGFQAPQAAEAVTSDPYLEAVVAFKPFARGEVPDDRALLADLAHLLEAYGDYVGRMHPDSDPSPAAAPMGASGTHPPRYWKVSPGRNASKWEECRLGGYMAVGWDALGDLSGMSQERFLDVLSQVRKSHPDRTYYTRSGCQQVFNFSRIQPGDYIVANRGQKEVLGIGRVTGPYYFEPGVEFGHRIPVDWFDVRPRAVNMPSWIQTLNGLTQSRFEEIMNAPVQGESSQPMTRRVESAPADLYAFFEQRGYWFPQEVISNYVIALKTKPFVILTGISGTGKTKIAQAFAEFMCPDEEQVSPVLPGTTETSFIVRPDPLILRGYMSFNRDIQELLDIPQKGSSVGLTIETPDGTRHHASLLNVGFTDPGASMQVRFFIKKGLRAWIKDHVKSGDLLKFEKISDGFAVSLVSAQREVRKSDRYAFISVRPDWMDNRGLLGYYNPLTEEYVPTELLRLMLRAAADPERPYFVILDEMNLAKVEHYFSDFLSCMESRRLTERGIDQEGIVLHERGEPLSFEDEDGRLYLIPRKLPIPLNLYITGTVNIDETTYMFSPKVLDRANTLEFNEVDLLRYGGLEGEAQSPSEYRLRHPLMLAQAGIATKEAYDALPEATRRVLAELNGILTRYHLHFGYRVANEIALYLREAQALVGGEGMAIALDLQILQKVLPKLHGARAKLEKPLQQLLAYLVTRQPMDPGQAASWYRATHASLELDASQHLALRQSVSPDAVPAVIEEAGSVTSTVPKADSQVVPAAYPRSAAKVYRMLQALKEQGYASFIV